MQIANQYRKPTGTLGKSMGKIFDSSNKQQNDWTISLLQIEPTDYVLEIGFGSGRSIKNISKSVTKGFVAGIDFSKVMIEQAVKRNSAAIKSGLVELKLADASSIPYPDKFFDKVFAVYVIYFWPDPVKTLKKIHRVVKPNGRIAIYLSSKKTLAKIPFAQTRIFRSYTQKELVSIFRKAGFKGIKCKTKTFKNGGGICVIAERY